jgi:hypothetical protein
MVGHEFRLRAGQGRMAYAETAVNTYRQRYNTPGFTGGPTDLAATTCRRPAFICADRPRGMWDDDNAARETIHRLVTVAVAFRAAGEVAP